MFFLSPVELIINLDSFGVSCLVLEISAVEIRLFSNIIGLNGALDVLTAPRNTYFPEIMTLLL